MVVTQCTGGKTTTEGCLPRTCTRAVWLILFEKLAPICAPVKIICIRFNYNTHAVKYLQGQHHPNTMQVYM